MASFLILACPGSCCLNSGIERHVRQVKWELGLETKLVTQTRALNSFPWAMFPFHRNLAEVKTFRSTNLVHPTDVS